MQFHGRQASKKTLRRAFRHKRAFFGMTAAYGVAGCLSLASTVCLAQSPASPAGRLLASNCSQCHGPSDDAPGFDSLLGKSPNKLFRKLKKYQSGAEGEGIMTRHASGYTDQQLRELAQWLSKQR